MDRRAPLKPVQRAILLSLAIGLPVWFVYVFYRMPRLSNLPRMFFVPEPLSAALISLTFGLAVSAILVLFMANRRRMGTVLKPNRGRLIVAAFLGFTMHIWNAEFMPIVPIGLAIALLPESFLFFCTVRLSRGASLGPLVHTFLSDCFGCQIETMAGSLGCPVLARDRQRLHFDLRSN